ncbi:hypothetical protein WH95_19615 [Kiloniella litopenaei]|uniref:Stability/partitioning determinant n=1 Tax=Kiloniella litopenaei TaxID=1549748 RepID=A0A0M2R6T2_9PROT|nr:hypothetical protein [Kiloniella litopenaei]KKJ75228.1 hypothetical protein WH95_19615 [Kiloniella litopenaei]
MARERATLDLDDLSDFKAKPPKKKLQKEVAEKVATEAGFTSRHSKPKPKVDGRSLRATNRTAQLNMSVKQETRDDFWTLASEQGFNTGEDFLIELMNFYRQNK